MSKVLNSVKARKDAEELDKIHAQFVAELPHHAWPRPNGFCVGENRYSIICLCLDDMRFLRLALECYEHWLLTEETKSIPLAKCFSSSQDSVVKSLEQCFSLRKFLLETEVPDVVIDEDLPF